MFRFYIYPFIRSLSSCLVIYVFERRGNIVESADEG